MEGKMKGYALFGTNKTGWVEKDIPECGPMDALLRPLAVAACTTDVKAIHGLLGEKPEGMILGHECVAEVLEVGSMVKDFKPGDRVVIPAVTPNWGAIASQEGHANHCNGPLCGWRYSNYMDGLFAEVVHCVEADANLVKLPDNVDPIGATMISDIIPPGFTAAELADIQFGETVLVIGIGSVGQMCVAACRMRGASRIIAVGHRELCKKNAADYGADDIIDYKDGDIEEQVMKLTGGKPVDRVCICGGGGDSFRVAVRCCKPGGKIGSIIAIANGDKIVIDGADCVNGMNNTEIIGAGMWTGRMYCEKYMNLIAAGRLNPRPLVTHIFHGWDQLPDAIKIMEERPDDLIKPVVILDESIEKYV